MKKILIISGSVIVVIGIIVVLMLSHRSITPTDLLTDRDTGESFDLKPEKLETGGSHKLYGETYVFGREKFNTQVYETLKEDEFLQDVLFGIIRYGDNRLDKKFTTLTIQPATLHISTDRITGLIRLGQTDTVVPFEVTLAREAKHAIVTINKEGTNYGGTFVYVGGIETIESYLFTLTQKDDHTSDLLVTTTYAPYREAALVRLQSLGYSVPDFAIEFSQSENPFQ